MGEMPRWASVAVAARCGRILTPILEAKWLNMPAEVHQLFMSAVIGAESAASHGIAAAELSTIAEDITKSVGVLELHLSGLAAAITRPMPRYEAIQNCLPANDDDIRIVRDILDVGARSARATTQSDDSDAYQEAMDGVNWTLSVLKDLHESELHDRVVATTERLHNLCEVKKATKHTTVRWSEDDWDMTIPRRAWWRLW